MGAGIHLIVELIGCDLTIVNNASLLEANLLEAARVAGCQVLHSYSYQFEPQGSTAVVVVSESHLAAHSAPEEDYMSLDIYTCMPSMMPYRALEYIIKTLNPKDYRTKAIERGWT